MQGLGPGPKHWCKDRTRAQGPLQFRGPRPWPWIHPNQKMIAPFTSNSAYLGKIGHQLKSSNFFFGKSGFQTPGLVPLDSSRNSVPFGGIHASGTPIWSRIGQKSILGHPVQKKVLKYARILLGIGSRPSGNGNRI